ncbi:hypothetical protein DKX38_018900 [Salix brachista]|uniref:NAC domain-containing protein n=1 Tax=Salix brachista TaxID=2182728 RepID=A0A5N5KPE0_9ROSI|nr:hypothetical protein DKX38_018900 [Salix brachista]
MQSSLPRPPPGFKFIPTDVELIHYCLYEKVHERLPGEVATLIKDCNLHGEEEPWKNIQQIQGHNFGEIDTFNKKMELGASTVVTSGTKLSQVQEPQQMTEK